MISFVVGVYYGGLCLDPFAFGNRVTNEWKARHNTVGFFKGNLPVFSPASLRFLLNSLGFFIKSFVGVVKFSATDDEATSYAHVHAEVTNVPFMLSIKDTHHKHEH